jgi:uncharacterized membrane protein
VLQPKLPGLEPEITWRDRVRSVDRAWVVVAAMVVVFFLSYAPIVYRRQEYFGSFGFDMGIFDQAIWVLAHFHSFITVRGLDFWGHHMSPAMLVFVPFYWLGQGAHMLNLVQVASMGAGAVPVFLIARERVRDRWASVGMAAIYLLHPTLGLMGLELFHPEVMAVTPLLFAYWFAIRHRWGWYAATLLFAVAWKEDVALFIIVLGLVVLFRHDRRVGIFTVAAAAGWYLMTTRLILPAVSGGVFYEQLYTGVGGSPANILRGAIKNPDNITSRLTNHEAKTYLWQMFAPFAFLPLAAPEVLAFGVPQIVANLLSDYIWTRTNAVHYAALPLAALTLASIEAVALAKHIQVRRMMVGVTLVVAIVTAGMWGISPIGEKAKAANTFDHTRLATKREAVDLVPAGAPVTASYSMVAHFTHRHLVYEYPNPFRSVNWGIPGDESDDTAVVQWIVIDANSLGEEDRKLLTDLVALGEFKFVLNKDGVQVARRVRPPSRNAEAHR